MKKISSSKKQDQGFTLVEIIVVLVILAVLAAFTIPTMLGFVEEAKAKAYIAEAREVYVAAQAVASEYIGLSGTNTAFNREDYNNANDVLNSYWVARINETTDPNPATIKMKNYLSPDFPNITKKNYRGDYEEGEAYWYIEFDETKTESAKVTEVYYVKNGYVVRYRDEKVTVEPLKAPNEREDTSWSKKK